jgi:predicted component of type VI protein secretion system
MKLSLEVLTPGKMQGKTIAITLSQFLIGRDPQCQLRPASALISKRHCAVLVRNGNVFVRDFDSTNGTFVNDEPVKGEREVKNEDHLKVGPLDFRVHLELSPPVNRPTPAPPTKGAAPAGPPSAPPQPAPDDEEAAAMLLSLQDDSNGSPSDVPVDSEGIPTGSTVMEALTPPAPEAAEEEKKPAGSKSAASREQQAKQMVANTSIAAQAILEKYLRRPRSQ